MTKKKIFLHIGTLKTGSKSLQRFLLDHADYLSRKGFALYRGEFRETNHLELDLAAMRYERDSFAKLGICKDLTIDVSFTQHVAERVRSFIAACHEPRIIFTSEALCRLRHDDEIDRLRTILDLANHEARVVLYLRNKEDFLRSYAAEIHKVPGRMPSKDPSSALYIEPDTWLTDYDSLIAAYRRGFGGENVVVIDYDAETRKEGSVIPSFLRVLGLESAEELDVASYFLNTTNPADRRMPLGGAKLWIERAKHAWLQWSRRPAA